MTFQIRKYFSMVLIFGLLYTVVVGQDPDITESIDNYMQYCFDNQLFNGAVLVAESGEVIYKKGFGLADMEWNIQNTPETKFRLGSITKQFTAMLIMQLAEDNQLKLQDPLIKHLSWYREDTGSKVTIHHLLTHTSGIPSYTSLPDFISEISRESFGVKEFVEEYCIGDLEFKPGTEFRYNNSGYFILGPIIEEITGMPYEKALQKEIFNQVEMADSGNDHHLTVLENRAEGYEHSLGTYRNASYLDMSVPYAAGALYSTVENLFLWDRALNGTTLLSNKYKNELFAPHIKRSNGYYAYGWSIEYVHFSDSQDSVKVIGHGGGINGFNTIISRIVDDEHLIIMLNNTGGAMLETFRNAIINILYDHQYDLPRIPILYKIGTLLSENDVDTAVKTYRELKNTTGDKYDFSEYMLNILGYQLLELNRTQDAIKILQLNVEQFPESSNVYDSLGEAYMKHGDLDMAVTNYAKSLELNPQNANAIRMLEKIQEQR